MFIEAARRRGGTGPCAAPRPARFGQDHPLNIIANEMNVSIR